MPGEIGLLEMVRERIRATPVGLELDSLALAQALSVEFSESGGVANIQALIDLEAAAARLPFISRPQAPGSEADGAPRDVLEAQASLELRRPRILIFGDVGAVLSGLNRCLDALGYDSIGPVRSIALASEAISEDFVDAAILDLQVGDAQINQIAAMLESASIPFAFAGDKETGPASRWNDRLRLPKPFRDASVCEVLELLTSPHSRK